MYLFSYRRTNPLTGDSIIKYARCDIVTPKDLIARWNTNGPAPYTYRLIKAKEANPFNLRDHIYVHRK